MKDLVVAIELYIHMDTLPINSIESLEDETSAMLRRTVNH